MLRARAFALALFVASATTAQVLPNGTDPNALRATFYQCTINVTAGTTDCTSGPISITSASGTQRVARVNLASNNYLRLDAFVDSCSASGYWFHLADSPTADGGGGDAGTTQHDAEAHAFGYDFYFYSTLTPGTLALDTTYTAQGLIPFGGCRRTQWTVYESQVLADNDADPTDPALIEIKSQYGFDSAPYAEPDTEDPFGADANLWYVALNRTIGNASRTGSGVNKVCFVLSDTTAPSTAVLSALCP
jgi:hypothetical protein